MTEMVTVSNGTEFYKIDLSDLCAARDDGFYLPGEKGRTIVSDGKELFEVPLGDAKEAGRDGYRDILKAEQPLLATLARPDASGRRDPSAAQAEPARDLDETVRIAKDASLTDSVRAKALARPKAVESVGTIKISEPATIAAEEQALEAESAWGERVRCWLRLDSVERVRAWQVMLINLALHAGILIVAALIILPKPERDMFDVLTSAFYSDSEQPDELLDVTIEKPEELKDMSQTAEIVNDLLADSDDMFDLDINDLAPATVAPEVKDVGAGPKAPIAGEFGGRTKAGRTALVEREGGNAASEAAVGFALEWLKRHQNADGSWSFDHHVGECDETCTQSGSLAKTKTGATGLAVLGLLGAGNTFSEGKYHVETDRGLNYLMKNAKLSSEGLDLRGGAEGNSGMYVQGICTIALSEVLAMADYGVRAKQKERRLDSEGKKKLRIEFQTGKRLRPAASEAVRFVVNAQNPTHGGWRYRPKEGRGDTSVVGWQVMALTSAHSAKLKVPSGVLAGADRFLDSVQSDGGANYGYNAPQNGRSPTTAIGLLCRMYMGWDHDKDALKRGVAYLSKLGPSKNNMYYNYYATQVMHHWGGDEWKKWNAVMRDQLINTQIKTGHAHGSWNLADPHGGAGGRLYMTCLALMTLEIYYRHMPLYREIGEAQVAR